MIAADTGPCLRPAVGVAPGVQYEQIARPPLLPVVETPQKVIYLKIVTLPDSLDLLLSLVSMM